MAGRTAPVQLYAPLSQKFRQWQIFGAVERLLEKVCHLATSHFLGQGLDALLRYAFAGLAVTGPEQSHKVIQGLLLGGQISQGQIQRQRYQ